MRAMAGIQLSEREFEKALRSDAQRLGWAWWHHHDSRRQVRTRGGGGAVIGDKAAAGFPDYVFAHSRHGIVFAELKTNATKSKLRPDQERSLDALSAAVAGAAPRGVLVHVWRPRDLDDVITPVLNGTWTGPRFYGFDA